LGAARAALKEWFPAVEPSSVKRFRIRYRFLDAAGHERHSGPELPTGSEGRSLRRFFCGSMRINETILFCSVIRSRPKIFSAA
jgi:hypothetical protein